MFKRVLVTGSTFPKWKDDSAPRFVLDTCIALKNQGLEILVLVPHSEGSNFDEEIDGVHVVRYPYFFPFSFEKLSGEGIVSKLKNNPLLYFILPFMLMAQTLVTAYLIFKFKPHHILANWIIPQGLVVRFLAIFFRNISYTIIAHGGDAALANKNSITRTLSRWILRRSKNLIVVSSYIQERLSPVLSDSIVVHIISMGVWPVQTYVDTKDIDVIFVGRLEEKKGLTYLLDALCHLGKSGVPVTACIIGNGSLKDDLELQSKRLGLSSDMLFHGPKSNNDVIQYLARSKIFVLPSINLSDDVEGMPTVIPEAMSQQAIVIATDAGGTRDIVVDGVNGLLIPQHDSQAIANSIVRLLNDEELCEILRNNALAIVNSDYAYPAIGKRIFEVIDV